MRPTQNATYKTDIARREIEKRKKSKVMRPSHRLLFQKVKGILTFSRVGGP